MKKAFALLPALLVLSLAGCSKPEEETTPAPAPSTPASAAATPTNGSIGQRSGAMPAPSLGTGANTESFGSKNGG